MITTIRYQSSFLTLALPEDVRSQYFQICHIQVVLFEVVQRCKYVHTSAVISSESQLRRC